ncbi:MAG: hypothetical protein HY274_09305 [Gammaproteobacteria bacterium]|nr:hypothetical protein [Gammaproteobacteria bacterium]
MIHLEQFLRLVSVLALNRSHLAASIIKKSLMIFVIDPAWLSLNKYNRRHVFPGLDGNLAMPGQ